MCITLLRNYRKQSLRVKFLQTDHLPEPSISIIEERELFLVHTNVRRANILATIGFESPGIDNVFRWVVAEPDKVS